jgi:hypothetical protein
MARGKPKHHELPQAYLRGFCELSTSHIWVFANGPCFQPGTKYGDNPRQTGVRLTALRADGYESTDADGRSHYRYEERLGQLERKADPVFAKIRSLGAIDTNDKETLAEYIFLTYKRLATRDEIMGDLLTGLLADSSEQIATLVKTSPMARALHDTYNDARTENGATRLLRESMVQNLGFVVAELKRKRWQLIKAAPPQFFVTTDSPVVFDAALGLSAASLLFPLSQHLFLLADNSHGADLQYRDANVEETARLNSVLIKCAKREIYSPHPVEWIHKAWRAGFTFAVAN